MPAPSPEESQHLFSRLFDNLSNRVTLQIVPNRAYEQRTIDEEEDESRPERDVTAFDPFRWISGPNPGGNVIAHAHLKSDRKRYENSPGNRPLRKQEGGPRQTSAHMHMHMSARDLRDPRDPSTTRGHPRDTRVIRSRPRFQRSRAPVRSDTLLYWIMITLNPILSLQLQGDGLFDGDKNENNNTDKKCEEAVQNFKKDLFESVARCPTFLKDAHVDVESARKEEEDSTDAVPKKRSNIAEKRRIVALAEEALRALNANDFDRVMHIVVLDHVLRKTGIELRVVEEEGRGEFDEKVFGADGKMSLKVLRTRRGRFDCIEP